MLVVRCSMFDARWTKNDGRCSMTDTRLSMFVGRKTLDDGRKTMFVGRKTMDDERKPMFVVRCSMFRCSLLVARCFDIRWTKNDGRSTKIDFYNLPSALSPKTPFTSYIRLKGCIN
jgi:hypothetical protein